MASYGTVTITPDVWTITYLTNPVDLANGLSGIPSLAAGYAVIFDMGRTGNIQVTTMNMLFNLDIVFLNADHNVTEVWRNVAPGQILETEYPAAYFIEMNAGEASGIEVGDTAIVNTTSSDPTDDPITHGASTLSAQWVQFLLLGLAALPAVIGIGKEMVGVIRGKQ